MVLLHLYDEHLVVPRRSNVATNYPELRRLGAAIREVRRARGWSQEALAFEAEIDRSYMSSIERGAQTTGVVMILRIAQTLDVTVAELMATAKL